MSEVPSVSSGSQLQTMHTTKGRRLRVCCCGQHKGSVHYLFHVCVSADVFCNLARPLCIRRVISSF